MTNVSTIYNFRFRTFKNSSLLFVDYLWVQYELIRQLRNIDEEDYYDIRYSFNLSFLLGGAVISKNEWYYRFYRAIKGDQKWIKWVYNVLGVFLRMHNQNAWTLEFIAIRCSNLSWMNSYSPVLKDKLDFIKPLYELDDVYYDIKDYAKGFEKAHHLMKNNLIEPFGELSWSIVIHYNPNWEYPHPIDYWMIRGTGLNREVIEFYQDIIIRWFNRRGLKVSRYDIFG